MIVPDLKVTELYKSYRSDQHSSDYYYPLDMNTVIYYPLLGSQMGIGIYTEKGPLSPKEDSALGVEGWCLLHL